MPVAFWTDARTGLRERALRGLRVAVPRRKPAARQQRKHRLAAAEVVGGGERLFLCLEPLSPLAGGERALVVGQEQARAAERVGVVGA